MRITYLGHAAFAVTLEDDRSIVFDPYESGAYDGALGYGPITGTFDIAVVSHDHADHCCDDVTTKAKHVVKSAGEHEIEGITITSIPTYHDESKGSERGANLISVVEAEGMRIAHLGDLGHPISADDVRALGSVDVVLVPVGGHFTIDAETAAVVVNAIGPKLVIPMHFKTEKINFPIQPVDKFADLFENVERTHGSEMDITKDTLPDERTVVVLDPAL